MSGATQVARGTIIELGRIPETGRLTPARRPLIVPRGRCASMALPNRLRAAVSQSEAIDDGLAPLRAAGGTGPQKARPVRTAARREVNHERWRMLVAQPDELSLLPTYPR